MITLFSAFGADKSKVDEIVKMFEQHTPQIKKSYADAVAKLNSDEKKAVNEYVTFALSQLDKYPSTGTLFQTDTALVAKVEKENEEFNASLKKKYPNLDIDKTMETLNKSVGDKVKGAMGNIARKK